MSFDVSALNIQIDSSFTLADETAIENAIGELYTNSPTAKVMLDQISAVQPLVINYAPNSFFSHGTGNFEISVDPDHLQKIVFFDEFGTPFVPTLAAGLAHEFAHAILALDDHPHPAPHFAGETVEYTNQIHAELGLPARLSYHGGGLESKFTVGESYSFGAKVTTVINLQSLADETPIPEYAGIYNTSDHASNSNDLIFGTENTEPLTQGDDNISAGDGYDFVYGLSGEDYIKGDSGDDFIDGGEGGDTLEGGTGEDILSYATSGSRIEIALSGSSGRQVSGEGTAGDANGDEFSGFEIYEGSDHNDEIDLTFGVGVSLTVRGGDGNDTIIASEGDDFLLGESGSDEFRFDADYGNDIVIDEDGGKIVIEGTELNGTATQLTANTYQLGSYVIELRDGNAEILYEPNGNERIGCDDEDDPESEDQQGTGDSVTIAGVGLNDFSEKNSKWGFVLSQDSDDDNGGEEEDCGGDEHKNPDWPAAQPVDPLVLDLQGNGIELINLTNSTAFFDVDDDGLSENTGWVAASDALLALDGDGNGVIEGIGELIGNDILPGFDELALMDSNGDGFFTPLDTQWANMLVWQDANEDGTSDPNELTAISDTNITSIKVTPDLTLGTQVEGNLLDRIGSYETSSGDTYTVGEVYFTYNDGTSLPGEVADVGDIVLLDDALSHVQSRGFGLLNGLHYAISDDPVLYNQVVEIETLAPDNFAAFDGMLENILYQWAGAGGIAEDSRGEFINAKQLAFLEQYHGSDWISWDGVTTNPNALQAANLEITWTDIYESMEEIFFVQGVAKHLFPDARYDFASNDMRLGAQLDPVIEAAMAESGGNADFWTTFLRVMQSHRDEFAASDAEFNNFRVDILLEKLGALPSEMEPFLPFDGNIEIGSDGAEKLVGEDGADLLVGLSGNDELVGSQGNDALLGLDGDDLLNGGDGADTLVGGAGNDFLFGGRGSDTYEFGYGFGDDIIRDLPQAGDTNTVYIKGVPDSDITVSQVDSDLVITLISSGETLTIEGQDSLGTKVMVRNIISDAGTNFIVGQNSTGTSGNDVLIGGELEDVLIGYAGNDRLEGRDGDDSLYGGDGNDSLYGGDGDDYFDGGAGRDTFVPGEGDSTIIGGEGNDGYFLGGFGGGQQYNITINHNGFDDAGDSINLGEGAYVDLIMDAAVRPEDATFFITSDDGGALSVYALLLKEGGIGDVFYDYYSGIEYRDLSDLGDFDTYIQLPLQARDGGELNVHFADGTVWNMDDVASQVWKYSEASDDQTVGGQVPVEYHLLGGDDEINVYANTQSLVTVYGGEGDDAVYMERPNTTPTNANAQGAYIYGGAGSDTIDGADGTYRSSTDTWFNNGMDFIDGGIGDDVIDGRRGDDTLIGGAGNDTLTGGLGDDIYIIARESGAQDVITDFEIGVDKLDFSATSFLGLSEVSDLDIQASGTDTLITLSGGQTILLQNIDPLSLSNAEFIFPGADADPNDPINSDNPEFNPFTLGSDDIDLNTASEENFRDGVQTVNAWGGNDKVTLADSNNWAYTAGVAFYGDLGNDTITGGSQDDVIFGNSGNDVLFGGDGSDVLRGGSRNDSIDGGNESDIIDGGVGSDTLTGGAGEDTFQFVKDPGKEDVVTDFTLGEDIIDISDPSLIGSDSLALLNPTQDGADTILELGDGQTIRLLNVNAGDLTEDMFVLNVPVPLPELFTDGNDVVDLNTAVETDYAENTNVTNAGAGNDQITLADADNWAYTSGVLVSGGEGNDTIIGGTQADVMTGGAGNDVLTGNDGADSFVFVQESNAEDTITDFDVAEDSIDLSDASYSALNVLSDLAIADEGGNARVQLGDGHTLLLVGIAAAALTADHFVGIDEDPATGATEGDDTLDGSSADDIIDGLGGNDTIRGLQGDDIIYGGLGNDLLKGNAGTDVIYGGDGDDTVLGGQTNDWIFGDAGNDSMNGGADKDILEGGSGNDTMKAGADDDAMSGDEGDDLMYGNKGNDIIAGNEGSDTLHGGTGDDTMGGGTEDDLVKGGSGNDIMAGAEGNDTLQGGLGNDTIRGGDGNDSIKGGDGADTLYGGAGDDIIRGGKTNDWIFGEEGNDSIHGGADKDVIEGGLGNDTIKAGSEDDALSGNEGDDLMYGNKGNDLIAGNEGNDTMYGGQGNDTMGGAIGDDVIKGGTGDDIINGEAGQDKLYGNIGNDTFVFSGADHSTDDAMDQIWGFASGEDRINLTLMNYTGITEGEGSDTTLGWEFIGSKTVIVSDASSNFAFEVHGEKSLDDSDFIF